MCNGTTKTGSKCLRAGKLIELTGYCSDHLPTNWHPELSAALNKKLVEQGDDPSKMSIKQLVEKSNKSNITPSQLIQQVTGELYPQVVTYFCTMLEQVQEQGHSNSSAEITALTTARTAARAANNQAKRVVKQLKAVRAELAVVKANPEFIPLTTTDQTKEIKRLQAKIQHMQSVHSGLDRVRKEAWEETRRLEAEVDTLKSTQTELDQALEDARLKASFYKEQCRDQGRSRDTYQERYRERSRSRDRDRNQDPCPFRHVGQKICRYRKDLNHDLTRCGFSHEPRMCSNGLQCRDAPPKFIEHITKQTAIRGREERRQRDRSPQYRSSFSGRYFD